MSNIDEQYFIEELKREGFTHVYTWTDTPNKTYDDHTHNARTAHVVIRGSITITMNGTSKTFKPTDRVDVPKGVIHSAVIGKDGCTYVIGE